MGAAVRGGVNKLGENKYRNRLSVFQAPDRGVLPVQSLACLPLTLLLFSESILCALTTSPPQQGCQR